MAKKTSNGATKQSIVRHHSDWIRLVERSGPFLSMPVLLDVFPQGLNKDDRDRRAALRERYESWQSSSNDISVHRAWVKYVLTDALELPEEYLFDAGHIPQSLQVDVTQQREVLKPDMAVVECDDESGARTPRMIVIVVPSTQGLDKALPNKQWKASPQSRMSDLVRGCNSSGITFGLLTNGEQWMLVYSEDGETASFTTWYASIWFDEPITLRAFRGLLSARRFFGDPDQTLERMFERSAQDQHEVTDQLGLQIRDGLETLVEAIDRIDRDRKQQLLKGVSEEQLYESCINVMMRLVFLFFAEERRLLPVQESFYEQNYSILALVDQLQAKKIAGEELLDYGGAAWSRLLALFRAMHGGVRHDDMYLPAYGGSLFDPDRFPFLEGRSSGTIWKDVEANQLPISDRTVLHILEALQFLEVPGISRGERVTRRISFRELDVEDIGHIYESLLDHTAKRAESDMLGLVGSKDEEPEISLATLEVKAAVGPKSLVEFLASETGKVGTSIENLLNKQLSFQESQLLSACNNNTALLKRIKPFANLIRTNRSGDPVVIPKGSVFVTAGTDRRSSGTHYTPRSLTEPIVQYTLEPLVYVGPAEGKPKGEWKLKSAKELLELKICDMACGSGAFLVQAARYMAERLLEAWDNAKKANPNTPGITPEGMPSTGKTNEALIPDDPAERKAYAMRIIAQRCLYGVDKNPLAAEMAKLSLWLLTLAKDKPFEFLDHSIRCGDSLVGLHSIDQLRHFSLKPDADAAVLFKGPLDSAVDEAINLRVKLEDMPANSVDDVQRQEKLLIEANEKIARLRCAADMLVASEFWGESAKDKLEKVHHAAVKSGYYVEKGPTEEFEQVAAKERRGQTMFHWPLEFPEVIVKRGGFDAFVGNPPFITGKRISSILGSAYEEHLKATFDDSKGAADICCFFLRRGFAGANGGCGQVGMISTKSIAEGDSRLVSLIPIVDNGGVIRWARHEIKWPGAAGVTVSLVVISRSRWTGLPILNDRVVTSISTRLSEEEETTAVPLVLNKGKCSDGIKIQGDGFIISDEERESLVRAAASSADVISPYITGMDMVQGIGCKPGAWIINFRTWSQSKAASYRGPFGILVQRVKPYRDSLTGQIHEKDFWKYWDKREQFFAGMSDSCRILACPSTAKYMIFTFIEKDWIASHSVKLFGFDDDWSFAVMQSTVHEIWAREQSGKLEQRLAYNLSKAFATFPWPSKSGPGRIGEKYLVVRRSLSESCELCFTDLYNRFHDLEDSSADIQKLRDLHVEMDQAVAAAYDWTDLDLGHGFHETKQGVRFTISELARREVLQRLLKLNYERHAEEVKQGLHGQKMSKATKTGNSKKSKKSSSTTPKLFGEDDDEGG